MKIIKTCQCGQPFTLQQWVELSPVDSASDADRVKYARDTQPRVCTCGAINIVRWPPKEYNPPGDWRTNQPIRPLTYEDPTQLAIFHLLLNEDPWFGCNTIERINTDLIQPLWAWDRIAEENRCQECEKRYTLEVLRENVPADPPPAFTEKYDNQYRKPHQG